MKFTYRAYPAEDPHAPTLYRPVVPLFIPGPKATIRWLALIDTGADFTVLPQALAEPLGIEVDRSSSISVTGIEHAPFDAYPASVDFELRQSGESLRWSGQAHFADTNIALLGNGGFMEFFVVTFDFASRVFEITEP